MSAYEIIRCGIIFILAWGLVSTLVLVLLYIGCVRNAPYWPEDK